MEASGHRQVLRCAEVDAASAAGLVLNPPPKADRGVVKKAMDASCPLFA